VIGVELALCIVDEAPDVAALVQDLRALYNVTGVELMLRIGGLILERLYGGDVDNWRSRGRKDFSFRKLEQHPELPFKASMLSRAVSIYVLARRRPDLTKLQNVSQTHLQEILNLEPDVQDRLLTQVEQEKWSVQKLRSVVHDVIGSTRRAGRRRMPAFSKQLRNLRSIVDSRLLVMDTANVTLLQLHDAEELLDTARRLCQQAEQVTRVLAAHMAKLQREAHVAQTDPRAVTAIRPGAVSSTKQSVRTRSATVQAS
jgi:hypothetical protein